MSIQNLIIANENVDNANQDLAKTKQEHQDAIPEFEDVLNNP
jgi:hypothetical protein